MNNRTVNIVLLIIVSIMLVVGGWMAVSHGNQPQTPMPTDQSTQVTVDSPAQKVDEPTPAPVLPPVTDDDRRLLAIHQYAAAPNPTPKDKSAAFAAVTYFTVHPNPAALPMLIQHIDLRNHPWDNEQSGQLHAGGVSSDPPMEQVFPVIAALKAYGVAGADAVIDALLAKDHIDIHDQPYNLMVETLFRTLDRDQLRVRVEQHLKPDGITPEIQLRCKALLKQLFG